MFSCFFIFLYFEIFSIKILTYLFIFCVLGYIFKLNGIFLLCSRYFEPLHKSINETWLRTNPEVKYSFVALFSFTTFSKYKI